MADERQVVLETVQVSKIFKDFWLRPKVRALDHVDIQVHRGEIFGLLGPNGSGKSTLVKILLGLLFPTSGRAAIFGRDPRSIQIKDRIGYMPEESYLYRYLNADETLDFYGRLFNLPSRERRHRVDLLLDMVGLTRQRKRPIVEYSKGMARRIGLAQALINDPDLVFLDEPTTGLDPIGTREIKDLILELRRRGKTVFLCSHLLADVEDVCDRVAVLYGGRVQRLGTIDSLLQVDAQTQITTDILKPDTVRKLLEVIREMEGAARFVKVAPPRDRLETFFLRVVEEARAARLDTSGAIGGATPASFFDAIHREKKTEDLLQELLTPKGATAQPGETPVVTPPAGEPPSPQVNENLLKSLVELAQPAAAPVDEKRESPESAAPPVVLPAGAGETPSRTTKQVLDDLLHPTRSGDAKEGSDDAPDKPKAKR